MKLDPDKVRRSVAQKAAEAKQAAVVKKAAVAKRPAKGGPSAEPAAKKKRSAEASGSAEGAVPSAPFVDLTEGAAAPQSASAVCPPGDSDQEGVVLSEVFAGKRPQSAGPNMLDEPARGEVASHPIDRECPEVNAADKGKGVADAEGGSSGPKTILRDFTLFEGCGFESSELAASLMKATILDGDWSVTRKEKFEDVRRSVYQDMLKVVHKVTLIDEALQRRCDQLQRERESAVCDREVAVEMRASMEKKFANSLAEVKTLKESLRSKEQESADLKKEARKNKKKNHSLKKTLKEMEKKVAAMSKELQMEKEARKSAEGSCQEAISRADEAARSAEAWAAKAVADFRASGEYEDEITEATSYCYRLGWQDVHSKIKAAFPEVDLSKFDVDVFEDEEGEEAEADGGAVEAEAPAAECPPAEEASGPNVVPEETVAEPSEIPKSP